MGMGQPLYDWIKAALGGAPVSKDGTVALVNATWQGDRRIATSAARSSRRSRSPALDGSSKESAFFTITFSPRRSPTPPATA